MGATNNATSSPGRVILVPVRAFNRIDRSSGLVLAAVAALALASIIAVVLAGATEVAADSSTPRGVVATYVRAIQAGDADRAWDLLSQNATAPAPGEPRPIFSRDEFRQQVQEKTAEKRADPVIDSADRKIDQVQERAVERHVRGLDQPEIM